MKVLFRKDNKFFTRELILCRSSEIPSKTPEILPVGDPQNKTKGRTNSCKGSGYINKVEAVKHAFTNQMCRYKGGINQKMLAIYKKKGRRKVITPEKYDYDEWLVRNGIIISDKKNENLLYESFYCDDDKHKIEHIFFSGLRSQLFGYKDVSESPVCYGGLREKTYIISDNPELFTYHETYPNPICTGFNKYKKQIIAFSKNKSHIFIKL